MKRRHLLLSLLGSLGLAGSSRSLHAAETKADLEALKEDWQALLNPAAELDLSLDPAEKTKDEWRKLLPPESFEVLFEEETEPPFSNALNAEKRAGVYACRACDLPLFTSAMKYDSGTGWPSFFASIPKHLATKTDNLLWVERTEYHCVRCGGHQGHVFDDGPAPTHERWCNNGLALRFIPRA
jgi:peptide-methionine (R)-S-oxide reductase